MRTAAAAGGLTNQQYTESIKGIVAQLLPYAQYSQTATSMLSAIAQEAVGPATSSFATPFQWVGNTGTATNNLNSIVQTATGYMSNLGTVAANLASTMDAAVAQAITNGAVNIQGITKASQGFTTALQQNDSEINGSTLQAMQGFVTQLFDAHQGVQTVIGIIDTMMTRMGATPGEVAAMNQAIQNYYSELESGASTADKSIATQQQYLEQLQAYIDSMHGRAIQVTTEFITEGGGASAGINPSALPLPVTSKQHGGLISGFGGGDIAPALLEPGEAVVPKHLVGAVAPFLKAQGVPGFASGGSIGSNLLKGEHAADTLAQAAAAAALASLVSSAGAGGTGLPIVAPAAPPAQFLGEWLPNALLGLGAGSPGSATAGRSSSAGIEQPLELTQHIHVALDGRELWQNVQKNTLKVNLRNNGIATGLLKPK